LCVVCGLNPMYLAICFSDLEPFKCSSNCLCRVAATVTGLLKIWNTTASALNVSGGTLNVGSLNATSTAGVTVSGTGVLNASSSITVASGSTLTINNSGAVNLLPHMNTDNVNVIASLSISGAGTLNVANNDLDVHNGTLGTVSTPGSITAEIAQGLHGPTPWTGTGITSSTAAHSPLPTALGVLTGAQYLAFHPGAQFDSQSVSSTDVLVKYTFFGDADLSGTITSADYLQIDNGFNSQGSAHPLTGWYNGDFNYDGAINGDDYTLIDNAFNSQGSTTYAATTAGPAEMLATDTAQIAAPATPAVPEPASSALLALCALASTTRRRRTNIR